MFKKVVLATLISVTGVNFVVADSRPTYDLVIESGRVMDPESGHDAISNVGIIDGKIVNITTDVLKGIRTINAKGLVVAPGFIDLHHHEQTELGYSSSAKDGVTTALELEDGAYPIASWYKNRQGKTAINYGTSVSHSLVRSLAFDAIKLEALSGTMEDDFEYMIAHGRTNWTKENSNQEQRSTMKSLIRKGLKEGALGIGYYLAGMTGADVEEMLSFYDFSVKENVTNFIHIRSFGQVTPIEAGKEVVTAAEKTGASIHVVHVNSSGVWQINGLVDLIDKARQKGLDVSTEVYPYSGASSSLDDPRISKDSLKMLGFDHSILEVPSTGERLTEASFLKVSA